MNASTPPNQDLVLIGGGHSHALVLKLWGMNPLPGVRLTLITDVLHTPYSGMLPGYVAGCYDFDACHIDLVPLARFAGARLIHAQANGLDLRQRRVLCRDRPPIAFDWLSLDIGSTPASLSVPGAADYAIPVKPIAKFLAYWESLVAEVVNAPQRPLRLAIVGGGAGGVELALAAQARFQGLYAQAGQPARQLEIHLIQRGDRLLPERTPRVGRRAQRVLAQRGLHLHLPETVCAVEAGPENTRRLTCESGWKLECDRVFWVTQAGAAPWLAESGLATDERGFVLVKSTLQSCSHPNVFATGDVATMAQHRRPKAGVFAVRQGKPLYRNLRNTLAGLPREPYEPQREFLILISTGDGRAIASRGPVTLGPHPWLWAWKDRIDRQFMTKFTHLPVRPMATPPRKVWQRWPGQPFEPAMRCAGCGAKLGGRALEGALRRVQAEIPQAERGDIALGLEAGEDAAVLWLPPGQALVQTTDYFPALVDDPYQLGQIAATHALSDLFAMGAEPQSALAIATLPEQSPAQQAELLYQLLAGATDVLRQCHAVLVGGHTTLGPELTFGLTCNGFGHPEQLLRKGGLQPGQALILTKALGTGALFAAAMRLRAKGRWLQGATESMLRSNQEAAAALRQHRASACTDVTGFGFLGHLLEMLQASRLGATLDLNALPVLPGAREVVCQGIVSSLQPENLQAEAAIANAAEVKRHPLYPLLFDPQTSGGLLAGVPGDQAEWCVAVLRDRGYPDSCIVGWTQSLEPGELPVVVTF